jgi:outer membrane receptor protein involved in Fe transport
MIRKLLLSGLVVLFSTFAMAQSGTLQGKVVDSQTKEPIPFANVVVELGGKLINGGTTDFEGNYKIKPILPGNYDVKVSYVGYKKKMYQGVVVNANKIMFLDIALESSATNLEAFEVVDYKVPLIDKDQTSTGGTMTSEEIAKMPGRSAEAVAVTVGGVFSDENGAMGGMRGQRSGGTATYIDGVRVIGSSSLPKSAIDQVSVITGGTPAMYGDLTGGIVNITTRGPSREFGGGIEAVTSELLDGYGYNLLGFSVQGPLIKGNDSTKSTSLLGFFISGEGNYEKDGYPASFGTYQVNDVTLDYLRKNPVRPTGTGFGSFDNSNYIYKDDFILNHARKNAESMSANFSAKIDVRTTDNTNLSFGGSYLWDKSSQWTIANSLFNPENNGEQLNSTWRVYGKFTQRFPTPKDSKSLVKNVYYSLQADYSNQVQKTYNPLHGDDIFSYGYVGKFTTHSVKSFELGNDTVTGLTDVYVQNGYMDTLYAFERSEINPNLSNYTDQYYNLYSSNAFYRNSLIVQNGGALLNGQLPTSVYGLYNNTGTPYNEYRNYFNTRFGINANGSADIGNHELQFGIQYEQRKESSYAYNPAGLWTLMRGITNRHIEQLDYSNPILIEDATGIFQDTIEYNRLYDANTQAYFDKQLREKLGLSVDGLDWIDLDSYDPTTFSVDMFSADELLNSGNPYVSYYGYDPYGNKLTEKPAFEDFFTEVNDKGNFTRTIGAYEPIYMAGYLQDRFAFNDLIFTIGVRFDRFDANQKVLKDAYLFSEAKTVKEVTDNTLGTIPTNMGDDYIVYVNDVANPSAIVGYRDGSRWFNSQGTEITDPTALETASGIAPYLVDPNNTNVSASAFKDYEPQNTISPRISFSFPISDEALFFAHYDVLTSRPTSANRMPLISYYFIDQVGGTVINNPNLKPERTTDYELGFQQKISNSSSLKFSAYYREFRDQIQAYRYTSAYPVSYISYNNIDFGTAKGVTLAYDMRKTKNLWLKVAYTLQFANATGSSATSGVNLITSGQPNLRTLSPIDQDRNHTISIISDYRYGRGKAYNGPSIVRRVKGTDKVKVIRILENTGANMTFQGGSGLPYSAQSNVTSALLGGSSPVLKGSLNGSRLPWQFRMDLKVDRDIYIKRKEGSKKNPHYMNVYVQVLNVLNSMNVMNVYRYTGNPDDDGYLSAAEYQTTINGALDPQSYRDLYSTRINSPYNYSLPRRIRLGLIFSF